MDEEYKQSDISKEVQRLMDEEGYEFGEAVKEAMAKGMKDGGLMIAIQKLAGGGMTYGDKTYHQYHDQFVPPDTENMMYANGGGVGSMMQPKKKPVVQGGVDNYLGKQPQVKAPRKWQSSPDKPATELAYITEAEKDLIIKENIHGGLEGGPNMGPSGIMSLDSFGDVGGGGAGGADTDAGGGYDTGAGGGGFSGRNTNTTSERDFDRQKANQRAALQIAERKQAKDLGYKERDLSKIDRTQKNYNKKGPGGIFSALKRNFNPLSLIAGLAFGPLAGLATRAFTTPGFKTGITNAFSGLNEKMRGINPVTGKANTQAEYEAMVADRKTQSRIDNMTDRMLSGKNFSQKNLDALMGQVDRFGNQFTNSVTSAINRDLQINPETPQFAKSYLQSVAKSLPAQTGKQLISAPPSKPNVTRDITYGDFPNAFNYLDVEDVDLYGTPKSTMPNYGSPGIMNPAPVERADPFSFDLSNAMADASTNTNQQILDNILNESIMKNKVQPFIDNQQKKNEELDKMRQELGLA